jgi:DNA invertase Pin-like site-specific DNA recombinase
MRTKVTTAHLERRAFVYVRQSTPMQVHEHVESKQRQYALVERAVSMGWQREAVVVIDEDQGKSGASTDGRTGFVRLADAVGHGEAGAILAVEVSRLARSSLDWQRLLSLCAVAGVVVVDEQAAYDPSDRDDRLLLDLKGTMSEAELHWLRLRLVGGRLNKARRGELRMTAPTGYVWRDGHFELDPDEAVRGAVRVAFERFAIEPSTWAVVRWAHETGFKFPTRRWQADGSGELEWRTLTMGRLNQVLHNPTYAGIYAYGRRWEKQVVVDGQIRTRRLRHSPEQWPVRVDATHPGYIDWDTFVKNQERLRNNLSRMHGATPGAPKNGPALLTGLVLCGRCGRRMRVDYSSEERKIWRYLCIGKHETGQAICWSVLGTELDRAVEEIFLAAMAPAEIDLSLAVEQEANQQAKSLQTQWQARIEQARFEARRAERRYKAVDPENRVVARTLEREWEARLRDLEQVERQYEDARRARHIDLNESDREQLRAMARQLPALWRASSTTAAERKAMLRLVIEVVTLEPIDLPRRATRLRVQWRSGVVDERLVDRPPWGATASANIERIRAMAAEGLHDEQIAARLKAEGLVTAKHRPWSTGAVQHLRLKHGIAANAKPRNQALPDRHPRTGHFSIPGAARRFGVRYDTVKNWLKRGLVRAHRDRFGRYNASWLEIDEEVAATLERLAAAEPRQ